MVTIDGQQKLVKAQLLCTVMDLPAKAALLNVIQYNGEYGCTTCKHPGCTVYIYIYMHTDIYTHAHKHNIELSNYAFL